MSKILLEIVGSQRVQGDSDKIEITTVGEFEETDNGYIISYNEEQEPPMLPIPVCVKIDKNNKAVEMTRTGAHYSCLNIEQSQRRLCHYGTEYGDILMGISGHGIEFDVVDGEGSFFMEYDIDVNGAIVSRNDIKLSFKKISGE